MSERAASIQIARDKFRTAMQRIGGSIRRNGRSNFRAWGMQVVGRFRTEHVRRVLRVRSGKLWQSFAFALQGEGRGMDAEGRFFSRSKYARLQEYGGVVKPVRRQFLAIPIEGSPAMTKAGRYGFSLYDTLPKGAYSFWVQSMSGTRAVLMGRKRGSKTAKAQPWFSLVKSVRIKPRLGFRRYIKAAIAQLRALLGRAVEDGKRGN